MSIETRINKIEKAFKLGYKPKLFGTPLENCKWTDEDEAKLLAKAVRLGTDLPRPIMGNYRTSLKL